MTPIPFLPRASLQTLAQARMTPKGCFSMYEGDLTSELAVAFIHKKTSAEQRSFGLCALCGERGIRTPGTVARSPHFECGPIDHSGISPIASANIEIIFLFVQISARFFFVFPFFGHFDPLAGRFNPAFGGFMLRVYDISGKLYTFVYRKVVSDGYEPWFVRFRKEVRIKWSIHTKKGTIFVTYVKGGDPDGCQTKHLMLL